MGDFIVGIHVGHIYDFGVGHMYDFGDGLRPVETVVDTGASDTVLPASLLRELKIEAEGEYLCRYANGESEWLEHGEAAIHINGRTKICPVIFGHENQFLLGATTLEIFKLAVDPVNQELIPVRGLRLGWGGPL